MRADGIAKTEANHFGNCQVCGKWDGLYLGRPQGDDLIYAGKVDHGFDKDTAKELQTRLKPLIRKTQPYSKRIAHRGVWVEPKLLAEIEYRVRIPMKSPG